MKLVSLCWAVFLAGVTAQGAASAERPVNIPIGVQLYSVRNQLSKDVPATLEEIKGWGVKYVELAGTYKLSPEKFKEALTAHGLTAVSGHFGYDKFRDDPESVMAEAEKLGLEYVGCAYIPHPGAFDEVACRQAAAVFNKAGEIAHKHHMRLFYHTHGYEFGAFEGGTMFDLLVKETNPRYVSFEMDVFWVVHGGQDPVTLLGRYPGRWALTHLKDMKKGADPAKAGSADNVVAGTGQLDIRGIMRAAPKAGVKYHFIEDESNVSEQQIPETLKFLHSLR